MTAAAEWQLSTREFRLLWDGEHGAPYPSSLLWTVADDPGHEIDKRNRIAALQRNLTSGQREALAVLTHPTYSLFIVGIDDGRDLADPSHHLRLCAAWGGGDYGYIARQTVSGDAAWGGQITLTRHETSTWTAAVVGQLPPGAGAGRLPLDTAVQVDMMTAGGETLLTTVVSAPGTAGGQFRSDVAPSTCGTIWIQVGSITDGYPPSRVEARYRDIPGDGRYLLILDDPGAAMGVDRTQFTKMLNRVINATRTRHKARAAS
ncbi:hypothetical protein [Williamsia sp. CHRR-6]|uniref:hypothetical protein n=1 Tax=Williamsia sp. CHRR-6 TaxID=2835871 RepID=UPI001BD9DA48|nr:hypothetical protein [Williamsia sp. CHRR-6]MBT0566257.1 hypothetical protein [Williamsia sp. CHRR-6]